MIQANNKEDLANEISSIKTFIEQKKKKSRIAN